MYILKRNTQKNPMTQQLTTTSQTALAIAPDLPADRNPAAVYLGSLSRTGRVTMQSALNGIADKLTRGRVVDARMLDWRALRYQHVAALRSRLMDEYAPATANKMLCAVRGVMKQAWNLGYIDAEEYNRIKAVKGVSGSTVPAGRAMTEAEIEAMLAICARDASNAGARDGALVVLLRAGGLRRAEICALTLDDYDAVNKSLLVRGKGNKQRELPLNDDVRSALADWLQVRGARPGALFCAVNKSGKVTIGGRLSPQSIYNAVIKRAAQAGVKNISTHDFRRTFVGDLLDAGADISTVQQLAGHASVTTTQRYDRRGEKTKRAAVDLLHVPYKPRRQIVLIEP
jgi:site-specific recombinase XerD